jgi:hypothetical protein
MSKKLIAAAAATAVASAAIAGVATAGSAAAQQEVAFSYANNNPARMTLTPLTSGSIVADLGSTSWCCWTRKTVEQDGEQLEVNNPLATFVGKHGSLTWRERIVWVDLPNGYSIATGTWRIVRGTGAYEHLAGQGHLALVTTGTAAFRTVTFRAVGLVAGG